jgi:hypothetical protein
VVELLYMYTLVLGIDMYDATKPYNNGFVTVDNVDDPWISSISVRIYLPSVDIHPDTVHSMIHDS